MHITQRDIGLVLVVVGLVMSVAAPVMGTAPVFDTESTNTTDTSDIVDGYTVDPFEANSSNQSYFEAEFDSTNPLVKVIDADTDRVVQEIGTSKLTQTYSNSTASTYNYARNFSHDEWANVVVDPNESQDLTVRAINNSSVDNPDTTNATITLNNSADRTVRRVTDDDSLTLSDGWATFDSLNWSLGDATAAYEADDVPIGGDNSTLRIKVANATATDRFDAAVSDVDSGVAAWGTVVTLDDTPVAVYASSVADEHPDDMSYGVYDESNNVLTLYMEDEFEDTENVDVSVTANEGFLSALRTYGIDVFRDTATSGGLLDSVPLVGMQILGFGTLGFGTFLTRRDLEV